MKCPLGISNFLEDISSLSHFVVFLYPGRSNGSTGGLGSAVWGGSRSSSTRSGSLAYPCSRARARWTSCRPAQGARLRRCGHVAVHAAAAGRQLCLAAPGLGVDPTQPRAVRLARRRVAVAAAERIAAAGHHGSLSAPRCDRFDARSGALVHWRMSRLARARARGILPSMLDACSTQTPDALQDAQPAADTVQAMREQIERMQAELEFKQTKIEALNFEIARLKRWRFGSSSESWDSTTQAVLFDAIVADTALEDLAAQGKTEPSAPRAKGQAVRQALPASLPRVDRHHEIEQTHCECGQALERIGEEVSEQLDCVPAQFFVLRHIRGKYAWPASTILAGRVASQRNVTRAKLSFSSAIDLSSWEAVGMWAKGAAVGNASRCPRTRPVRRRRIVHMSTACRARSARAPVAW